MQHYTSSQLVPATAHQMILVFLPIFFDVLHIMSHIYSARSSQGWQSSSFSTFVKCLPQTLNTQVGDHATTKTRSWAAHCRCTDILLTQHDAELDTACPETIPDALLTELPSTVRLLLAQLACQSRLPLGMGPRGLDQLHCGQLEGRLVWAEGPGTQAASCLGADNLAPC